jgi:hypothetical protein
MLLILSLMVIIFGFCGCALKVYPITVTEAQRKAISDTARENFVEGMLFGVQLEKAMSPSINEMPNGALPEKLWGTE